MDHLVPCNHALICMPCKVFAAVTHQAQSPRSSEDFAPDLDSNKYLVEALSCVKNAGVDQVPSHHPDEMCPSTVSERAF